MTDYNAVLARFEAMEDTFATVGWRCILEELTQEVEVLKEKLLDPALSNDELREIRGAITSVRGLMYLEDTISHLKKDIVKEEDDADV